MRMLVFILSLLSLNSYALDLTCYVTDEAQAQQMYEVGESEKFDLLNFDDSKKFKTTLDGGLFNTPYVKDFNYIIEISNECDNFVTLNFYDTEVNKLFKGETSLVAGYMHYESETLNKSIKSVIRCMKK